MNPLASALARSISRLDGLLLLEVPDAIEVKFLAEIVASASSTRSSEDGADYSILLTEGDESPGVTCVDSRGLAGYRQGHRLVVCHQKDYKAQATFSSTLSPALPRGFPLGSASEGALADVAIEAACLILGKAGPTEEVDILTSALSSCMRFLALAYEEEAESGVEWRARWWRHSDRALRVLGSLETPDPASAWAAFGLPQPAEPGGYAKAHDARRYVEILESGWADPADLARRFEAACGGSRHSSTSQTFATTLSSGLQSSPP